MLVKWHVILSIVDWFLFFIWLVSVFQLTGYCFSFYCFMNFRWQFPGFHLTGFCYSVDWFLFYIWLVALFQLTVSCFTFDWFTFFSWRFPVLHLTGSHFSVDGFLFLLIGTALYNQLLDLRNFLPCWVFPAEELRTVPPGHHSNIQDVSYSEDDASEDETTRLLKGRR